MGETFPHRGKCFLFSGQKMTEQFTLWGEKIISSQKGRPYLEVCRELAEKYGVSQLSVAQIFALILGCPKETAEELEKLGISKAFVLEETELIQIKGIGKSSILRFRAVHELIQRISHERVVERPVVKSPQDIAALVMEEMRFLDREYFKTITLNTKNQVLAIETVSVGSLNSSIPGKFSKTR